jgi:hypothetical protein
LGNVYPGARRYTWLISLPFGAALLGLDEGRKAIIRNNKQNAVGEFFRY